MSISQNELNNTVSAQNQLRGSASVWRLAREGAPRVLFVGNSITRHAPKPEIGWYGDWGMAASSVEKDYVHRTVALLEERCGGVDFCVAQLADWERRYTEGETLLPESYAEARDYGADVVVIRIGENMPKGSAPEAKPDFAAMIRFFCINPDAQVVITDSFWRNDARDAMIRKIAEEQGYIFCRIGDLEQDPANMALGLFEHRGVASHPSDAGMEQIAKRLADAIEPLIRQQK